VLVLENFAYLAVKVMEQNNCRRIGLSFRRRSPTDRAQARRRRTSAIPQNSESELHALRRRRIGLDLLGSEECKAGRFAYLATQNLRLRRSLYRAKRDASPTVLIGALKGRALLGYPTDFDVQTVFESRALLSDFDRFIEVADLQQEITANRFFRFSKRAIRYALSSLSGNEFAFIPIQGLAAFDLALLGQPVHPGVPPAHDLLYFLRGKWLVPARASE
jgi:hypothetical protein